MSAPPYDSLNLARHVGDDPAAVTANLGRLAALVGLTGADVAVMEAAHGGAVAVVDAPGPVPAVDALVTTRPGIGLVALAADCVPVALADPEAGVVGVVHCGWPGLVAGVVSNAVAAMAGLGARDIRAVLGPSICARCYPVPRERVDAVRAAVAPSVAAAACIDDGRATGSDDPQPRIDVAAGVLAQLAALGVFAERLPGCTAEDPALFSYRRACLPAHDGARGDGRTGRQGMIVRR